MAYAGIVPHALRRTKDLGNLKISDLIWPLGAPEHLDFVKQLSSDDHIATYPYSKTLLRRNHGISCNVNLILVEPKAIHGLYYTLLPLFKNNFHMVFSRYESLVKQSNNLFYIQPARSSLSFEEVESIEPNKYGISLIASKKKQTKGHKLRHKLIEKIKSNDLPVEILGRGYAPFEKATEALAPYKYSVVIENAQEENYFTEKLIDCLLNRTIPIYWGTSDINKFFDTSNWLIFNSAEEGLKRLEEALKDHQVNDDLLGKNYQQALEYMSPDAKYASAMLKN